MRARAWPGSRWLGYGTTITGGRNGVAARVRHHRYFCGLWRLYADLRILSQSLYCDIRNVRWYLVAPFTQFQEDSSNTELSMKTSQQCSFARKNTCLSVACPRSLSSDSKTCLFGADVNLDERLCRRVLVAAMCRLRLGSRCFALAGGGVPTLVESLLSSYHSPSRGDGPLSVTVEPGLGCF